MKTRAISMFMALIMLFSLGIPAFAEEFAEMTETGVYEEYAADIAEVYETEEGEPEVAEIPEEVAEQEIIEESEPVSSNFETESSPAEEDSQADSESSAEPISEKLPAEAETDVISENEWLEPTEENTPVEDSAIEEETPELQERAGDENPEASTIEEEEQVAENTDEEKYVKVVFICDPKEGIVKVFNPEERDEEGKPIEIEPEADGTYLLLPGAYIYSVAAEEYEEAKEIEFTVSGEEDVLEITVQLEEDFIGLLLMSGSTIYNPGKAVEAAYDYYERDWACSKFVAKCVTEGGLTLAKDWDDDRYHTTTPTMNDIVAASGVSISTLTLSNGYVKKSDNPNLAAGDVVGVYCPSCDRYPHMMLCVGFDSSGYAIFNMTNNPNHDFRWRFVDSFVSGHSGHTLEAKAILLSQISQETYTLYCNNNYSGKNYLYGSDFSFLNSEYWFSRDTSVATISIDSTEKHNGYNSLKIVNLSAGSSGRDISIQTLTQGNAENEGYVGESKNMILSFWAKSSVDGTKINFRYGYDDNYRSVALTTSWQYYTVRMDKTPPNNNYIHPYVDRAGTVWLAEVQLEDGTAASRFVPENTTVYQTVTEIYGENYTLPSAPSRAGYTFLGWYTAASGGTQVTSSNAVQRGDCIVYAHWDGPPYVNPYNPSYTVEFYNGVDYSAIDFPESLIVEGSTFTVPETVPRIIREFYNGTIESPLLFYLDGEFNTYYPGETYSISSDLELQAAWKTIYTITQYCYGPDMEDAIGFEKNWSSNISPEKVIYGYEENPEGHTYKELGITLYDEKNWPFEQKAPAGYSFTDYEISEWTKIVLERRSRNSVTEDSLAVTSFGTGIGPHWELKTTPTITQHPVDVSGAVGKVANFSVEAEGNNLSYQWQFYYTAKKQWRNITASDYTGVQSANMGVTVTAARDGYRYRCIVSNDAGSVTSEEAVLSVATPPVIRTQPGSVTAGIGEMAYFSVWADEEDLSYQWQFYYTAKKQWRNITASDYTGVQSANMGVMVTAVRNGYRYRCIVTNSAGSTTSNEAVLTVTAPPVIRTQPVSATAVQGETAGFTIEAEGEGLSYQWQFYYPSKKEWRNITASDYTGVRTANMTVTATSARNGYRYRCIVTNGGGKVTSEEAVLTILTPPVIQTQPVSATAKVGDRASFSVTASGSDLRYQWQFYYTAKKQWRDITASDYTGVQTAAMEVTATAARNGYRYRCIVTNAAGSVTSTEAIMTVQTPPVIVQQPASAATSAGSMAYYTVGAVGDNLSYQWQFYNTAKKQWRNITASDYTGIQGATMGVTVTAARNGYRYRCIITNAGGSVTSAEAVLTVN